MVVLSDGSTHPHAHPVPLLALVGDSYSSLYLRPHLLRDPVLNLWEYVGLAVLQVVVVSAGLHQSMPVGHPKCLDSGFEVVVVEVVVEVVVHPLVLLYHLSPYDLYLVGCSV